MKKTIITTALITLIVCVFFLTFYTENFLFLEEMKIFRYYNIIFIPILLIHFTYKTIIKYKISSKSGGYNNTVFFGKSFLRLSYYFGFYIFFLRPFILGTISYINTNVGKQSPALISGTIIKLINRKPSGRTTSLYRFSVVDKNEKVYEFETTKQEIIILNVNTRFEKEMTVGSLGILYKKQ